MADHTFTIEITAEILLDAAVAYALTQADLVAEFDRLRGTDLSRKASGLDLLIDLACKRREHDLKLFREFVADVLERAQPGWMGEETLEQ